MYPGKVRAETLATDAVSRPIVGPQRRKACAEREWKARLVLGLSYEIEIVSTALGSTSFVSKSYDTPGLQLSNRAFEEGKSETSVGRAERPVSNEP